jgi:ATP-binding cassette, subfamily B, bacterial
VIDLYALGWPASRIVEALETGARHASIPLKKSVEVAPVWGASELAGAAFDSWVDAGADWLGIEAEPVDVHYHDLEALLRRAPPVLVRIPPAGPVLLLIGRRGDDVLVLTPELEVKRVRTRELKAALCRPLEAPVRARIEGWLNRLGLAPERLERLRSAVVADALEPAIVTRCYLLRLPPGADFWSQARFEGLVGNGFILLGTYAAQYGLGLLAWYTLGSGAFSGGLDRHWLFAWALVLLTAIPFQMLAVWLQGKILLGLGTLLKRRLMSGTLRVDADQMRRQGAGQLLGRALESSALESVALSGALISLLAIVEFVMLSFVFAVGPGGLLQTIAFLAWGGLTLAVGWRAFGRIQRWTRTRRDMTGDLVEQMAGHRTRLAQQAPRRWHDGEDETLERYLLQSGAIDRSDALIRAMPYAWFIVGLGSMLPSLMQSTSAAALAVGVGAVVLGAGAIGRLSSGLISLAVAASSWSEVKPLFEAAGATEARPSPDIVASHLVGRGGPGSGGQAPTDVPLLDATDLAFSYPTRPLPVLRGGVMRVRMGDRILVEGPSGGGKSTFASLLAGLRQPQSGLLLLEGLDWQTVGPVGWRRRVAAAPQYHDNHVLSETFLFNVLMGRRWPPSPQDVRDAEEVCRALGLGDLLGRMPAGMMQMVGDQGWRLSHGEQSRLFIARALLQEARVVLLDESFAALDPKTVEQCLRCVFERAPALVVIAHP